MSDGRLLHTMIRVFDLEKSIAFYTQQLGMKLLSRKDYPTGEFTLVECYARSVLFCSWMTVLVGDPLYNPFKKNAKLKLADGVPSPKGGRNTLP